MPRTVEVERTARQGVGRRRLGRDAPEFPSCNSESQQNKLAGNAQGCALLGKAENGWRVVESWRGSGGLHSAQGHRCSASSLRGATLDPPYNAYQQTSMGSNSSAGKTMACQKTSEHSLKKENIRVLNIIASTILETQ